LLSFGQVTASQTWRVFGTVYNNDAQSLTRAYKT